MNYSTKELQSSKRIFWFGMPILLLVPLMFGCGDSGPKYYQVQGTVLFEKDDTPAQFGTIEFRSNSTPPVISRGKIAKDGTFTLKASGKPGTVEGTHSVVIIQVVGNPRDGSIVHNHGHEVLDSYSNHKTTDLKVEITDETELPIVLKVKARE